MTRLAIEGLTKKFGDVIAVETLDLAIDDHEFISLLGPSGCGKTTTLRCIAGFEQPSAGRITFDGDDIVDRLPEDRNIGMVFQNYALFPHMTVRENLAFGLETARKPKAEIERRRNFRKPHVARHGSPVSSGKDLWRNCSRKAKEPSLRFPSRPYSYKGCAQQGWARLR